MALIYITGPSGSGKTTIAQELNERGYEAHDADTDICSWYNNTTGEKVAYPHNASERPADWQTKHSFLMSQDKLGKLLKKSAETTIFVCGIASNDLELAASYFCKVFCLMIDEPTMVSRVTSRKNNKYGQAPDQVAVIKQWYSPTIKKYLDYGAIIIDATRPIAEVASDLISQAQ